MITPVKKQNSLYSFGLMEKALKKTLKNGKFDNVPAKVSKTMSAIKGKGNKSTEIKFKMALVRNGISGWRLHPKYLEGKPDIYFPKEKIAVFLDGCYWHGCPKCGHIPKTNTNFWKTKISNNKKRDAKKRRILRRSGVKVLKFWEHELYKDVNKCVQKLEKHLS